MSDWLQSLLFSPWLPVILFFGAFGDAFILTSMVVFGEIFFIATGFAIATLDYYFLLPLIWLGAITGDVTSFFIGRHYGPRIVTRWIKNRAKWRLNYLRAKRLLQRRGISTVFVARLAGPVSKLVPFIAGTLRMPSKIFIAASSAGVMLGSAQFILAGWLIATGIKKHDLISKFVDVGYFKWIALLFIVILLCWYIRNNKVT